MDTPNAVFGIFQSKSQALRARARLQTRGFSGHDFLIEYPSHATRKNIDRIAEAPLWPFAKTGAYIGSLFGGAGFAFVALLIVAGIIPVLPEGVTLTGQIIFVFGGLLLGAVVGAASGALIGAGISQLSDKRYALYLDSGGILMSIHVNNANEHKIAKDVLASLGAEDISPIDENISWESVHEGLADNKANKLS